MNEIIVNVFSKIIKMTESSHLLLFALEIEVEKNDEEYFVSNAGLNLSTFSTYDVDTYIKSTVKSMPFNLIFIVSNLDEVSNGRLYCKMASTSIEIYQ